MPALAASYARPRGLAFVAVPPDFERHPGNARDRRDENVVGMADAAVVVWERLVEGLRKFVPGAP